MAGAIKNMFYKMFTINISGGLGCIKNNHFQTYLLLYTVYLFKMVTDLKLPGYQLYQACYLFQKILCLALRPCKAAY